ncbi:MAG: dienelactone hydrolase family protein [Candidatus Zixiibacteriota bacterium]|nr:MAG: dienelactone hydrolase family protein [candidate division Zixibacteria bacterium]
MNSYFRTLMALGAVLLITTVAEGALKTQAVEYKDGDVTCEGYLAYDDTIAGLRPGVLVVHEWMGLGPYAKMRADKLAQMGYVAFAADIYGKGVRPKNTDEAATQASIYRTDRQLMRRRAQAALQVLAENKSVDRKKIAAIGYCFGGGTVLELARSGADLAGVDSFHGNLDTPNLVDAKNIKGKILVQHGGSDPYVPAEQLATFEKEMTDAGVNWQVIIYGGAVHSFTNPDSGTDPTKGAAYNEQADKRSWLAMKQFFDEIFK